MSKIKFKGQKKGVWLRKPRSLILLSSCIFKLVEDSIHDMTFPHNVFVTAHSANKWDIVSMALWHSLHELLSDIFILYNLSCTPIILVSTLY